jgi:apolipoprotein N-acyltransferase
MRSAESSPDLIVWPETAVPGKIPYNTHLVKRLASMARRSDAHLLVGSSGYEKFNAERGRSDRSANSAFLFSPEGEITGRYDKIRLVPFNEYLPLRSKLTWPAWIADQSMIDARPGEQLTVFEAGSLRFGVQICWENLFPDLFRKVAAQDVDFMVSMTNDNFTNAPAARYQMLNMNVFRAIENGVTIIRSSTSGVSAIILPNGEISVRLTDDDGKDLDVEGYVTAPLPTSTGRTFYNRHGDWFVALLAVLLMFLIIAAAMVEYRSRGAWEDS